MSADHAALVVVGCGGHGAVVCDLLRRAGFTVTAFSDDNPALHGTRVLGLPVISSSTIDPPRRAAVVIGIGRNAARRDVFERFRGLGYDVVAGVHPAAVLGEAVEVHAGAVVMAGVIVNPRTVVGENAVLNTGCRVDHDCRIGAHAHVAPGAILTGAVMVGEGALVGAGAVVLPGVEIGRDATVGAGAVVTCNVAAGMVVAGVPARRIR